MNYWGDIRGTQFADCPDPVLAKIMGGQALSTSLSWAPFKKTILFFPPPPTQISACLCRECFLVSVLGFPCSSLSCIGRFNHDPQDPERPEHCLCSTFLGLWVLVGTSFSFLFPGQGLMEQQPKTCHGELELPAFLPSPPECRH